MPQFTGSTFSSYTGRWLIIVGVFELALAGVFVLLGLSVPFVGEGMFLTAAILGVTGVGLLYFGMRARRSAVAADLLLRTGIAGSATITSLTQTGMYLNENPQVAMDLLVQLPDRPPYAAQRKEFVPLIMLGRLTSGAPLPVRVDPADPQRLIVDWANAGSVGFTRYAPGAMPMPTPAVAAVPEGARAAPWSTAPGTRFPDAAPPSGSPGGVDESLAQIQAALQQAGMPGGPAHSSAGQGGYTIEQLRAVLRQDGIRATARIDQAMDMGQVVGDEKLYMMQVTLELPGRPPEQLKPSAAMVPLSAASKVRVGWRVPVRVAADNHQLLLFEWERA